MKEVKKSPAKKAVAPKAPAAKKVAEKAPEVVKVAPKVAAPKAAPKAPAAPKAAPAAKKPEINPEQRYNLIQEAAYFIAERHGFNGDSAYFWSLAEAEVNNRLS